MTQITVKQVHDAYGRLHRAMGWTHTPPYTSILKTCKSNVGAVYLEQGPMTTFAVCRIVNRTGGVTSILGSWRGKRAAYDSLVSAAQAVELFKRENDV